MIDDIRELRKEFETMKIAVLREFDEMDKRHRRTIERIYEDFLAKNSNSKDIIGVCSPFQIVSCVAICSLVGILIATYAELLFRTILN